MSESTRRKFLRNVSLGLGTASMAGPASFLSKARGLAPIESEAGNSLPDIENLSAAIDFRFSPLSRQTAYCFPDDHHKSLIGEHGDLRYGHPGQGAGTKYFPEVVEFSLLGMEANEVRGQRLEAPGVPIIHTRIDRPEALLQLTTFATQRAGEGRVDNVILEVEPRTLHTLHAVPVMVLSTKREIKLQKSAGITLLRLDNESGPPFLLADVPLARHEDGVVYQSYVLETGIVAEGEPSRCFLRFPQEGQEIDNLKVGLETPDRLLTEARQFWQNWKPFEGKVSWQLPGRHGEFLVACARNLQQAREEKGGRITFQVGPTCYRGLWVVDGNFILEAARYLGYDKEAQEGLEATWRFQDAEGGVFAGGGREHWKDTGIAMFTLARQAELSQDWGYFREMQPNVLRAVKFLVSLRDKARSDGSMNGHYGLLAPGFGDGGLGGIRSEFTNTLWVLAGLKAVTEAADQLALPDFGGAKQFYNELRASFFAAAGQEMRRHPQGFDYLPMLVKEDSQWATAEEWDRPRPQIAQWALSHAIYPGLVFEKDDPIVKGHVQLMQSCTQEDIPAETGWLPHGGVWNYNAGFVAHVYLWAGIPDWARLTFTGFLNHATPLYCWREEQPIRGSLTADYVGDMPHNWASAECILYLRHLLALEDGLALRLLAGVGDLELADGEPLSLAQSPTRFGRIDMYLEPLDRHQGWRMKFQRGSGPTPAKVLIPETLASRFRFAEIQGAQARREGNTVSVAPSAAAWQAVWRI
ncbi:MAG: hypothetical protein ACLQVM_24635 [Terriglobia bacterium]